MNDVPSLTVALIVAYRPDLAVLARLIDQCAAQTDAVIVVDNSDGRELANWLAQYPNSKASLLPLGDNLGIATAQNRGIDWARARGASHVLIFDHDSDPPPDLAARLHAALASREQAGEQVAAVGPRYTDSRRKEAETLSPFVRFEKGRLMRCKPDKGSNLVPVDFLISSGSLIPVKALDAIGPMADEMFIDYVDVEWGLRARQAGRRLYGVWDAVMDHSLGDAHVKAMGREIAVHSPLRHYYLMRNAMWLCLRPYLWGKWKFIIAHNALKKFVAYSLFMPQPFKHFRMMCIGVWHGATGRMGRLS